MRYCTVKEGDRHLVATRYGAAARSQRNRLALAQYHQELLADVSHLVDETEAAARAAAQVVNREVEILFLSR
jgi:hypothetical protein